jgi:heparan-alpha-glucosaminide N-acetyltransferase
MNTVPSSTPPSPISPAATTTRLQSLDAYRGLIMFTLLCGGIFHSLKGHPTWNWLFLQNEHVAWAGCVYWDLIQPSFMFMVGVSMPFAFARREELGDSWGQRLRHALIRAFNLMAIGILLDHFGSDKIQIGFIRVLQQIAIGYAIAFFVVGRSLRTQGLAAGAILVGYQLLWMFNPWNGPGGPWAQGAENIGSAFDRWMLGRNYSGLYVGMNAIPAAATIIFGVMAGTVIRQAGAKGSGRAGVNRTDLLPPAPSLPCSATPHKRVCLTLLIAGVAGIAFGLAVSPWFPLIKRIWTPSFAIYAAGWTTLILLAFYWSIEVMSWRKWSFPLVVVGMNSIAAYVLGGAFGGWFRSASTAWVGWLKEPLGEVWWPVFQRGLFAVFAWGVLYWLWRRKIFFKA